MYAPIVVLMLLVDRISMPKVAASKGANTRRYVRSALCDVSLTTDNYSQDVASMHLRSRNADSLQSWLLPLSACLR